jgi:hypothetical protein
MTLILELTGNKEADLRARASLQGVTAEQFVQQIVDRELEHPAGSATRRVSQRISEIMADVPPEAYAELPEDGARQVDHYIYGLPKRD